MVCQYYLVDTDTASVIAITLALGKGFGRFCCGLTMWVEVAL
jgi:hypothetical protein